jgi:hypothetical protein
MQRGSFRHRVTGDVWFCGLSDRTLHDEINSFPPNMRVRFYIVSKKGLRRLRLNVFNKKVPLPQFAGTRQKVIAVQYERRADRLLLSASGSYYSFDKNGCFVVPPEELQDMAECTFWLPDAIRREQANSPKVTNLELHRRFRRLKGEQMWAVSEEYRRAIKMDLLGSARPTGSRAIPLLES